MGSAQPWKNPFMFEKYKFVRAICFIWATLALPEVERAVAVLTPTISRTLSLLLCSKQGLFWDWVLKSSKAKLDNEKVEREWGYLVDVAWLKNIFCRDKELVKAETSQLLCHIKRFVCSNKKCNKGSGCKQLCEEVQISPKWEPSWLILKVTVARICFFASIKDMSDIQEWRAFSKTRTWV